MVAGGVWIGKVGTRTVVELGTGGAAQERAGVGGSNSVVESQPSKLLVAGSIPVSRSNLRSLDWSRTSILHSHTPQGFAEAGMPASVRSAKADVAQLAEHV